uniref:Uncharacterized protein AlNc14C115G6500 n=1 Tax=Albugo laibachii Nc14 TaxID=890382 RepID=F0WIW3_9STRA|nr:conserved hypothetical protein [Albugo laibachii Nc14]|eukprot:CCA21209.1 conserved hypothetical protein [Albugo laibachii Nc14]
MFNAIFYQMNEASLIPVYILVPLPVFFNMLFLQPRIFQRLVLLSSIVNIRMAAFLEVATEFIKVIEGRADFIQKLYTNLALSGKTVSQLHVAFAEKELSNSGHISLENFWSIMTECGVEYSALRFKTMIQKLFPVLNNDFGTRRSSVCSACLRWPGIVQPQTHYLTKVSMVPYSVRRCLSIQ